MKRVSQLTIIGDFATGYTKSAGQQAKTLALARALREYYDTREIRKIDTWNWRKHPFRFFYWVVSSIFTSRHVIMLPASRGVLILGPLLVLLGSTLSRRLYYIVIGGWLPEMTKRKKWLAFFLKKFNGIYVETSSMKTALEQQGFTNIFIMPNFKDLPILKEQELVYTTQEPFSFCTFSRVMKEKGIEDAINVITQINTQAGRTVATLDIYGKVDDNYQPRFNQLKQNFPIYIQYKGVISPNQSVSVLRDYFALLFPTYYAGEGFPGTLLDAMASGIPVIASDWKYNKEIVSEGKTGVLIHADLVSEIKNALTHFTDFNAMKPLCLQEAQKYTPKQALRGLLKQIKEQNA